MIDIGVHHDSFMSKRSGSFYKYLVCCLPLWERDQEWLRLAFLFLLRVLLVVSWLFLVWESSWGDCISLSVYCVYVGGGK